MNEYNPVLGIVSGYPLSPNMEAVLANLGKMLSNYFALDLVSGDEIPDNIKQYYKFYKVPTCYYDLASLRYAKKSCEEYLKIQRPHLLMNIGQPSLGNVMASFGKKKNVTTIVRITGDLRESGLGRSWKEKVKSFILHRKILLSSCRKASCILALGPIVRRQLIDYGINPQKIYILPQPFDPEPFYKQNDYKRQDLKNNLDLQKNKKVVLFVGRLSWLKGVDRLLEIIYRILKYTDNYQFCVIGKGEYEYKLKKYPQNKVHVADNVPHKCIFSYYQVADLLLVPSRTEGLPNVILEALAAQLPIIATPVGEIQHYVSNIAETTEEFVDYIINENWKMDVLPSYFAWENQRENYIHVFNSVISRCEA